MPGIRNGWARLNQRKKASSANPRGKKIVFYAYLYVHGFFLILVFI